MGTDTVHDDINSKRWWSKKRFISRKKAKGSTRDESFSSIVLNMNAHTEMEQSNTRRNKRFIRIKNIVAALVESCWRHANEAWKNISGGALCRNNLTAKITSEENSWRPHPSMCGAQQKTEPCRVYAAAVRQICSTWASPFDSESKQSRHSKDSKKHHNPFQEQGSPAPHSCMDENTARAYQTQNNSVSWNPSTNSCVRAFPLLFQGEADWERSMQQRTA